MTERVLGAILAGGLARRMGGGDKTLRTVGGRAILAHVVERLRPQCRLVINANGDPARFSAYGLPVIADTVPDFAGPLAGVLAALDYAAERHPDTTDVVTVAADTPFLPRDLVEQLLAGRTADCVALACARSGGRTHPVVGLWPVTLRDELRRALVEDGERKIDRFTSRFESTTVEWPSEPFDPFFNANEPADLDAAERLLPLVGDR